MDSHSGSHMSDAERQGVGDGGVAQAQLDVGRVSVLSILQNQSQKSYYFYHVVWYNFHSFNKFCFSNLYGHKQIIHMILC